MCQVERRAQEHVVRIGERRGTIVLFPETATRRPLEWKAPLWVWGIVLAAEVVLAFWSA
jgi:hypothetical protein